MAVLIIAVTSGKKIRSLYEYNHKINALENILENKCFLMDQGTYI